MQIHSKSKYQSNCANSGDGVKCKPWPRAQRSDGVREASLSKGHLRAASNSRRTIAAGGLTCIGKVEPAGGRGTKNAEECRGMQRNAGVTGFCFEPYVNLSSAARTICREKFCKPLPLRCLKVNKHIETKESLIAISQDRKSVV